jgi:hypothetical protein
MYSQIRANTVAILASVGAGIGGNVAAIPGLITAAQAAIINTLSALFFFRAPDADNTRAAGVLPGGGAWDGAGRLTDGYARVDADLTCVIDAAGMFYVIHGPTVIAVDACDPTAPAGSGCIVDAWSAAVAWTAHRAPIGFRDKAYRLAWRGTAGNNLTIAATLDPRPVDHEIPLAEILSPNVASGIVTQYPCPPGTRIWSASARDTASPNVTPLNIQIYASGASGDGWGAYPPYGCGERQPVSGDAIPTVLNNSGTFVDLHVRFYP